MAGIAHAGGIAIALSDDNVEAPNEADARNNSKYTEQFQNVVFKVAICIVTVTSGVILNSPLAQYRRTTSHNVLSIAYVVAMFLSFSLGLALLLISVPHSNVVEMSPLIARRLMFVTLGFVYSAMAIGTVLALLDT